MNLSCRCSRGSGHRSDGGAKWTSCQIEQGPSDLWHKSTEPAFKEVAHKAAPLWYICFCADSCCSGMAFETSLCCKVHCHCISPTTAYSANTDWGCSQKPDCLIPPLQPTCKAWLAARHHLREALGMCSFGWPATSPPPSAAQTNIPAISRHCLRKPCDCRLVWQA